MKTQNLLPQKRLRRFETLFSSFVLTSNEKGGHFIFPKEGEGVRVVQGTVN
jgi:hypothetical protein